MTLDNALLTPGQSIPLASIPELPFLQFRDSILAGVNRGGRIISWFVPHQHDDEYQLLAILSDDARGTLQVFLTRVGQEYASMTSQCPQLHLFERKIWEEGGPKPLGHPWLKGVRSHDSSGRPHPFFRMQGQEVHEVAVGPVHAGVIEPGHFRFQCTGEIVQHLEIQLGYQHRGIEAALRHGPHKRTLALMETAAGDTTIGHATAYCQVLESLGEVRVPARAQALRALALELERLANHVGDIGALANDVGFLPTASYCGRLRGDLLNLTLALTGNRLGHGFVRPGGVGFDIDRDLTEQFGQALERTKRDAQAAMNLFFDSRSCLGRLSATGTLPRETCLELGIVGVAARASGVPVDVRCTHPTGWYESSQRSPVLATDGDVLARAQVRREEILQSFGMVRSLLKSLPFGPARAPSAALQPLSLAVGLVEGWRGQVTHVALTDAAGRLDHYQIVDPSFHNWSGLAAAMRGQQISDFPLCNKSFNLSYCGFDL